MIRRSKTDLASLKSRGFAFLDSDAKSSTMTTGMPDFMVSSLIAAGHFAILRKTFGFW